MSTLGHIILMFPSGRNVSTSDMRILDVEWRHVSPLGHIMSNSEVDTCLHSDIE